MRQGQKPDPDAEDRHMQGEESRQSEVSKFSPAHRQPIKSAADLGQKHEEAHPCLRRGVALLIPAQEIARQTRAESKRQKEQPSPEHPFPGCCVEPGENANEDCQRQKANKNLGPPVVKTAQQPAQGNLVLNEVHAFPGRLRGGAVIHPEEKSRDGLLDKEEKNDGEADGPPAAAESIAAPTAACPPDGTPASPIIQPIGETHRFTFTSGQRVEIAVSPEYPDSDGAQHAREIRVPLFAQLFCVAVAQQVK